jgi:hypothetical protein
MADRDRESSVRAWRQREERMRYEVLSMLSTAAGRDPEWPVDCGPVTERIGVWRDEIFRVIDFLDRRGLVRYCGEGPRVCITPQGVEYLSGAAQKLKRFPNEI